MTTVDVAIPCYQYGSFLRDSAMSVLSQDVDGLRLLIIDNASTDDSRDIARELAADDDRVSLIFNDRNRGMHHSCNRAVDWAEADYFVLLDADDLLAAGALALGTAFLDEHREASFLYGVESRLVDGLLDPGRCDATTTRWKITKGREFIRRTCWDSFCDIGAPAVIARTSAQKRAGHFTQSLVRTFDFEMYLRLAMFGDVASTNRVLGIRRMHEAQLTTAFARQPIRDFEEHEKAFESFFSQGGAALPAADDLAAMATKKLGDYAYWFGVAQSLRRGPHARAAFDFAAARREAPEVLPPLTFLFKKRWLRSSWRAARRAVHSPAPLPPSFEVPRYL
ncbi:glycosyltransferase family 2 protein [Mycolicibacterium stellerae]|uniref:glycosyltransferase family 2 protein n=1 Tax=Mycolicibacterium stellerae TaxID=2358193 RepID=UPI0013DDB0E3|nr:glycosyltransferase family A protein [Mycolicibacterium stellerae]